MKVKYIGETFGAASLTNDTVYDCLAVENGGEFGPMLRIVDDSGEDYLYSATHPAPLDGSSPGGKWIVIEDDEKGTLAKAIIQ